MFGLLYRQSKFWFFLVIAIFVLSVGSINYFAASTETQTPIKKRAKIDLTDRLSDFSDASSSAQLASRASDSNSNTILNYDRPFQGCPRLQSTLYDLSLENYQERFGLAHGIVVNNDKARVVVVLASGASLPNGYFIDSLRRYKQNVLADVPIFLLCSLANETGIDQVRIPTRGEILDLSGATGSVGISDLLGKSKNGYQPTDQDFQKYGIDPDIFKDLLNKLKNADINVKQN